MRQWYRASFHWIVRLVVMALLCTQLVACTTAGAAGESTASVTVEALSTQLDQGHAPLLLDVRSPEEYAAGHIPGARNIHFRDIPDRLEAIGELAENADTIVVYCERGVRATKAEKALIAAGFSNVIQLTGHMKAWRNAAFPIEKVPESAL